MAGWFAGEQLLGIAVPEMRPMNEPLIHRLVMSALIFYVLAAAIPFVPGAEIGFALLLAFGSRAVPLVYVGMISALLLAYLIASSVPLPLLARLARWLRLNRTASLIDEFAAIPVDDRAASVSQRLDGKFGNAMLRNRYLLLALLLNLPGNSALGGGGGLAFMAGISGLFNFWVYALCVLIAVAPIPILFLFLGE